MTNEKMLGTIGEIYYQALFGGLLSTNEFDNTKDLIDNEGKSVELKTQSRLRGYDAFTINKAKKDNLRKCLYVDKLIFIEYSLSDIISIYECVDRRSGYSMTMEENRIMFCWPIEKMVVIKKVKHPMLAKVMRQFSKSETLGHFE